MPDTLILALTACCAVLALVACRAHAIALRSLLAIGIVPFALCLWWIHPQADDWSFAAKTIDRGWFDAQRLWYQSWTGRFVANAVVGLWAWPAGPAPWAYRMVAWSIPAVAFAIAWWSAAALGVRGSARRAWSACGIILAATLLMPHTAAAWYWLAASVSYLLGTLLAVIGLLLLHADDARFPRWRAILAAVASALAVGCSESVALINGGLLLALLVLWPQRRPALLACLIAAALAFAVVVAAPGNQQRLLATAADHGRSMEIATAMLRGSLSTLRLAWHSLTDPVTITLVVAAWPTLQRQARRHAQRPPAAAALALLLVFGSVAAAQAAAFYALGSPPPGRAANPAVITIVASTLLIAPACAPRHRRWWRRLRLGVRHARSGQPGAALLAAIVSWVVIARLRPDPGDAGEGTVICGIVACLALLLWLWHRRHPADRRHLAMLMIAACVGSHPVWHHGVIDAVVIGPRYDRQLEDRYRSLRRAAAAGHERVRVPALDLPRPPSTFHFIDLTWVGDAWPNDAQARCFGLRELWLEPLSARD